MILAVGRLIPLKEVVPRDIGMGSRAQHFGGASLMSFLIKSSETGAKVHNPVPANSLKDAGTGHESSTRQMFAIFSCMKLENALGRSERGMLVGSFGSVVLPMSSLVTLYRSLMDEQ